MDVNALGEAGQATAGLEGGPSTHRALALFALGTAMCRALVPANLLVVQPATFGSEVLSLDPRQLADHWAVAMLTTVIQLGLGGCLAGSALASPRADIGRPSLVALRSGVPRVLQQRRVHRGNGTSTVQFVFDELGSTDPRCTDPHTWWTHTGGPGHRRRGGCSTYTHKRAPKRCAVTRA